MQTLKAKDRLTIVKDNIEYEFEVAPEGGYVVTVPDLPGCVSEGRTFEEALEMIQDAVEGWLHVAARHGDSIPRKFRRLTDGSNIGGDG